jgi:hypothetical protein
MAHLLNTVPGAVGLFSQIDFSISLQFLTRFHCQTRADWLSPKRLSAWLKSVGYSGRIEPTVLYARLTAAPRGATGPAAAANGHVTQALAATLTCLVQQIRMPNDQIATQLAEHADAHIFTSLPAPAPCLPPDCSARSQTAADGFLARSPWHAWPASHHAPDSPANNASAASAGPRTNSCATRSATSLATPDEPTLGRRPLPQGHPTRTRPSPRRAHPGLRMAPRDLALPASHSSYDPAKHRALQRLLNQDATQVA